VPLNPSMDVGGGSAHRQRERGPGSFVIVPGWVPLPARARRSKPIPSRVAGMHPQPDHGPVRLHWSSFRPPNVSDDPIRDARARGWATAAQRRRSLIFGGGLIILLVLWGAWQAFAPSGSHHALVGTLFFVPADAIATLAALGAAARCAPEHSARTAWRLLACAFAVQLAGVIGQVAYESSGPLPFPSFVDAPYLAFYALLLAGLLSFPSGRPTGVARLRFWLDLAIVALTGALAVAAVIPTRLTELGGSPLNDALLLAFPAGDLIVLGAIGAILLRRTNIASTVPIRLLAAGIVCFVASKLILIQGASRFQTGHALDAVWLVGIALFALAAATEPGAEVHAAVSDAERPAASWAPYLAMLVASGLLIADHRSLLVVIVAVAIIALLCTRQALASTDVAGVQRLASHDGMRDALTGLPNRRQLIADLQTAIETASPTAQRTLVLFDLDGFKAYNDTFGHPAGDQLLGRLGRQLQDALPASGRAYRLGGDEFCALVSRSPLSAAEIGELGAGALSERGPGFAILASAGAVTLPAEATDVASALHAADRRMYAAKHSRSSTSVASQMRDVLLAAIAEQSESIMEQAELTEHMLDVGIFARDVARQMGLEPEQIELTLRTGELHDVGKIAIPESILYKPGPLNDDEWLFVRKHTLIGERVLSAAPALIPVAKLVRSTHERFDGGGYPDGLAGERIPLPARIVFACDAYHAMVADRPYAAGVSEAEVRDELRRHAGTQFDPHVVEALEAVLDARSEIGSPADLG
jgi:two-component system, cell cycle response regulator